MKLKYIFTIVAGSMLMLTACTPDSYDMGSAQYTREALVESEAYTVTVEGNRVHLKSNIPDCTPLWITPQGRSKRRN